jgi:hypothetical protein
LFPVEPTIQEISKSKIFEEPLWLLGAATPTEVRNLSHALNHYMTASRQEQTGPLETFLETPPASVWKLPHLVNLGLMDRHTGRTMEVWKVEKQLTAPLGKAHANRGLGGLLEVKAGLGRMDRLNALVEGTEGGPLSSLVTEKLNGARGSLNCIKFSPEMPFFSPIIPQMESGKQGTGL